MGRRMNAAYLHLLTSHAPVCAVVFGLLLWVLGWCWRGPDFRRAALVLFLLAGLLSGPAYLSGAPARRALTAQEGWDARAADQHEEVAALALGAALALAAAAGFALFRLGRASQLPRSLSGLLLGLALLSGATLVWTSGLGGRVRHVEIRQPMR
jgi:MFS family permease